MGLGMLWLENESAAVGSNSFLKLTLLFQRHTEVGKRRRMVRLYGDRLAEHLDGVLKVTSLMGNEAK